MHFIISVIKHFYKHNNDGNSKPTEIFFYLQIVEYLLKILLLKDNFSNLIVVFLKNLINYKENYNLFLLQLDAMITNINTYNLNGIYMSLVYVNNVNNASYCKTNLYT